MAADERASAQATLQRKLVERMWPLFFGVPLATTLVWLGMMEAAATYLPLFVLACAVYLPNGPLPEASMPFAVSIFAHACVEVAVANARISLAHLSNGRWQRVHEVRTSVSIYFIVAELLYAYDLWRRKGARAWTGIRCVVIVGCVVRLVANCLLLSLGHDHLHAWRLETIYLPGNITFLTSMVIDIGYMVFFAFGVSPHNRRRLSQLMGRDSVVCSLAELLTEPDEVRGTSDSESASDAPSVRAPSENASDAPRVLTPSDEHASAASEGRRLPSAHSSGLSKRDSGAYVGPLHARGRRGAASCYSQSSLSSAGSELGRALADSASRAPARVLPTYPLRPQFYQDTAVFLPAPVRARLQLHVRDGELVNQSGHLLACNGEAVGMYVMDEQGRIFSTLGVGQEESLGDEGVRHSSLVAGGPVAAAGILTVACGRVLRLSNESGHYAPPPSCLTLVLERLAELGLAHLDDVVVETTRRREYEPAAASPTSGRRATRSPGRVLSPGPIVR